MYPYSEENALAHILTQFIRIFDWQALMCMECKMLMENPFKIIHFKNSGRHFAEQIHQA